MAEAVYAVKGTLLYPRIERQSECWPHCMPQNIDGCAFSGWVSNLLMHDTGRQSSPRDIIKYTPPSWWPEPHRPRPIRSSLSSAQHSSIRRCGRKSFFSRGCSCLFSPVL